MGFGFQRPQCLGQQHQPDLAQSAAKGFRVRLHIPQRSQTSLDQRMVEDSAAFHYYSA